MSPRGWVLFAAVSVVWGVPYLFIKLAVRGPVAGLRGLVAGGARGAGPAAGRLAQRRAARPAAALAGGVRAVRDHDPVPADRVRRAARLVVAGGDPDRGRAAGGRLPRAALRPRASSLRARASSGCWSASAAWSRWWGSTSAGAARSWWAPPRCWRPRSATRRPTDRQAPPHRPGTRSARSPARSGSPRSCCCRSRSAASRPRRRRTRRSASVVVLGADLHGLGLPDLLPADRRDRAQPGERSSPT